MVDEKVPFEIARPDGPYVINVKRLYVPFEIKATCPYCGETVVKDLQDSYLGYPTCNTPTSIHFYHEYLGEKDEDWDEHEFKLDNVVINLDINTTNARVVKYG
jgi:hypothetical protein